MSQVVPARLSIDLVKQLNQYVKEGRYANRSEVIQEAVRQLVSAGALSPLASSMNMMARLASLIIAWNSPIVETILLYGSLARGETRLESDIDLLIIINPDTTPAWKIRQEYYKLIYPLMVSSGIDISLNVVEDKTWKNMVREEDPLTKEVLREGVSLWKRNHQHQVQS